MTRVVVAPDKFKGSLTAAQAASALAAGLGRSRPGLEVLQRPVADGGEGTLQAVAAAGYRLVPTVATGPHWRPLATRFARLGDAAVIELAAIAGLSLPLPEEHDPLHATTFGVGQMIRRALDLGCRRLVLAVGGSATTDGGIGMMHGLGARLRERSGAVLSADSSACTLAHRLDLSAVDPRIRDTEIVLAADVTNPLFGADGAAHTFAPQKGADPHEVELLEARLRQWARLVTEATGVDAANAPGAGAAGGVGFAALALLGATFRRGIDLVIELTGLDLLLADASLVITGEGSLDAQSLGGKAPVGIAQAARSHGVPVVAVAGTTSLTPAETRAAGFTATYTLTDLEPEPARAMARAADLVECVGARIAEQHLPRHRQPEDLVRDSYITTDCPIPSGPKDNV